MYEKEMMTFYSISKSFELDLFISISLAIIILLKESVEKMPAILLQYFRQVNIFSNFIDSNKKNPINHH